MLIIGILAAIALPQYRKAVERAKMAEAIINLRAIADAHQVYHLANGVYAKASEMDKLDVQIPGTPNTELTGRITTKDFIYSPNATHPSYDYLALAQRADNGVWRSSDKGYYLYITPDNPSRIGCLAYNGASNFEKELCNQINKNGTL